MCLSKALPENGCGTFLTRLYNAMDQRCSPSHMDSRIHINCTSKLSYKSTLSMLRGSAEPLDSFLCVSLWVESVTSGSSQYKDKSVCSHVCSQVKDVEPFLLKSAYGLN